MKPVNRREKIVDLVRDLTKVSVDDLADRLQTSKETIRRDLTILAEEGRIRKVHGSALLPELRGESAFHVRMNEAAPEKRGVGARAAELFGSGDALFVDTGTTTLFFLEALAAKSGLTIITNSILGAQAMARGKGQNKIFILGGEYYSDASENLGSLTIEQIGRFNAHHAVLTVGAITSEGILDFSLEEAEVARMMVQRAKSVTVVADGSKMDREALFKVCALEQISQLVISRPPQGALAEALALAKVQVIVATATLTSA
ncbi:DeoR/GlpR family DNA-binding transcription regulator [Achromobacter aegrifaciens]